MHAVCRSRFDQTCCGKNQCGLSWPIECFRCFLTDYRIEQAGKSKASRTYSKTPAARLRNPSENENHHQLAELTRSGDLSPSLRQIVANSSRVRSPSFEHNYRECLLVICRATFDPASAAINSCASNSLPLTRCGHCRI